MSWVRVASGFSAPVDTLLAVAAALQEEAALALVVVVGIDCADELGLAHVPSTRGAEYCDQNLASSCSSHTLKLWPSADVRALRALSTATKG